MEEGKSLADRFDAHFIETSAEIGENTEEIMVGIVEKIKENLSTLPKEQGSKANHVASSNKSKIRVFVRAGSCIQRLFKRFNLKSKSHEDLTII